MKKIIPFNNVLEFNTDVKEITAISLEHEIKKYPDMFSGVFYISGEYKISEGLLEREKFNFELPFDIALTNNYNLDTLLIDIDDFRYDLVSDKKLKVNIDLYIDGEIIDTPEERNIYTEELPIKEDLSKDLNLSNQSEITDNLIDLISNKNKENIQEEPSELNERTIQESNDFEDKITEIDIKNTNISLSDNQTLDIKDNQYIQEIKETAKEEIEETLDTAKPVEKVLSSKNNPYNDLNDELIDPERIDLLKDMLTNNKENTMNEESSLNNNTNENINTNILTPSDEEKYVTYRVYKVTETDTIDTIITKYNVTKEMLSDYNNIENIIPGDKLIIPTNQNDEK